MFNPRTSLLSILSLLILPGIYSCGTDREVTVVDRNPERVSTETPEETEAGQAVLRVGELNPVLSLDPLFAVNTTSRRTVNHIYEGLVAYDEHNNIKPAGARRWEVSDDSLTYTFHLDRQVFFHDSEVFHNGIGRRVRASDYVRAFHRMASPQVPEIAAELFIDHIRGFESYYKEQREVYFPEDRFVNEISGIRARNDSTLVFELDEPSEHFLQKLASPLAVVYPPEAINRDSQRLRRQPVGTGPFAMNTAIGDSIYVLEKNEEFAERQTDYETPQIDRLEILQIPDETRLYQQLALDNIDLIADLGPGMISELINEENELNSAYAPNYRLLSQERSEPLIVNFNPNNRFRLSAEHAQGLIARLSQQALIDSTGIASIQVQKSTENDDGAYFGELTERFPPDGETALPFAFQRDLEVGLISGHLLEQISGDINVSLLPRRVSSRDIFMYITRPMLATPGAHIPRRSDEVMRITYDRHLIMRDDISNIHINDMAWWLDLTRAEVPVAEPEI